MKSVKVFNESNLPTIDYNLFEDLQGDFKTLQPAKLNKLKKSILKHGVFLPKFVWLNNNKYWTMDGHQSKKALGSLAEEYTIPEIPIVFIKAKNKKDAIEKLLIINSRYGKINRQTELFDNFDFNVDDLIGELEIPELNIEVLLQGETAEDDEISDEVDAVTQTGDLWELGRHRVLCGDSSIIENINELINIECIDLLLTDPPYGQLKIFTKDNKVGRDNVAKCRTYKRYEGEGCFDLEPILKIIEGKYNKAIIWGGNYFTDMLPITTSWIVWDKRAGEHSWFSDCEMAWTNLGIVARIFKYTWQGMIREGKREERIHPTQKPIALYEWILAEITKRSNTILDLFLGSGSTLIACEKLNRICYGIEIDPHYCDIIVQRYKNWCIANNREYKMNRITANRKEQKNGRVSKSVEAGTIG